MRNIHSVRLPKTIPLKSGGANAIGTPIDYHCHCHYKKRDTRIRPLHLDNLFKKSNNKKQKLWERQKIIEGFRLFTEYSIASATDEIITQWCTFIASYSSAAAGVAWTTIVRSLVGCQTCSTGRRYSNRTIVFVWRIAAFIPTVTEPRFKDAFAISTVELALPTWTWLPWFSCHSTNLI